MTPQTRVTAGILAAIAVVPAVSLLLSAPGAPRAPVAAPAPEAETKAEKRAPDGVTARAHLRSSHVLVGDSETFLAVTVTAPDVERRTRPPLNLAVVLDRSGSMSGEKLDNAKLAARELVGALTERDRISVVSYGSDVDVPLPSVVADADGRALAFRAIDAIVDDGGTNLSGGLEQGRDQALPHHQAGAVSRVVLISDGLANEGITDPTALAALAAASAERGVSVTTIGVGLDFDERLMTRLAVAGTGNYYFVEHADELRSLFADELGKIGNTVATEVVLEVNPAPGVDVREAFGYELHRLGNLVRVSLADLHAGETRKVVLRLGVYAPEAGGIDIASLQLGYRPISEAGAADHIALVEFTSRAEATSSTAEIDDHLFEEAVLHIERARTAAALEKATEHYERGDVAAARATLEEQAKGISSYATQAWGSSIRSELAPVMDEAEAEFDDAALRPGSAADKRVRKASRKKAYDLHR